jgi:osmotically-inducible protein OsmY
MKLINYFSAFFLALLLTSIAGGYGPAVSGEKTETDTKSERTPGEFIDDALIAARIKAAFIDDPKLSAFAITVDTYKGNVQLSGFVDSQEDINRAAEVAREIQGVKSVKNNLQLKNPAVK